MLDRHAELRLTCWLVEWSVLGQTTVSEWSGKDSAPLQGATRNDARREDWKLKTPRGCRRKKRPAGVRKHAVEKAQQDEAEDIT